MGKIFTFIIFTGILIFFVWQILNGIDKQIEINHENNCKMAIDREDWSYLERNCNGNNK